jgi:hypothetical protein
MTNLLDDQSTRRRDWWDNLILYIFILLSVIAFIVTHLYLDHLELYLEGIVISIVLAGLAIVYVRTTRIRRENKEIYDLLVTLKDRMDQALPPR